MVEGVTHDRGSSDERCEEVDGQHEIDNLVSCEVWSSSKIWRRYHTLKTPIAILLGFIRSRIRACNDAGFNSS